jgi:DNA-3-methyladenine glycosylase
MLGKLLARRTSEGWLAGRIVEVEAYLGPHITATPDPAAHSFRGITDRNRVMFGPPGHAYVYFIYGMHYCVNVTCEPEGMAGCLLIRALEPVLGRHTMAVNRGLPANASDAQLTAGPGRLCQALGITRPEHNGLDLLDPSSPLQLLRDRWDSLPIQITPRIGIRHAADLPLRFALEGHTCVLRLRQTSTNGQD